MYGLHQDLLPPAGVEFATSLRLTPSSIASSSTGPRTISNVVVARSNVLRVFEIRKENETEEGAEKASLKFHFVREHQLHGVVTGMEGISSNSTEDSLDRLLVSFRDAKIALLEWSEAVHDFVTVSIHTYERAPQVMSLDSAPSFRASLRVDPMSRCAALSLPKDAIAILPFHIQGEVDDDMGLPKDIPYSPSFILEMATSVDKNIHNVVDFAFLPGFTNPTIAVLFQTQLTWTGRLKEHKDTTKLVIFALNLRTQTYPIITSVEGLPHDCLSLLPGTSLGAVVVFSSNAMIYIDQSGRRLALPVNGWAGRVSDLPLLSSDPKRILELEGSSAAFIDEKTMLVILRDGTVYPVDVISEGKSVIKLDMKEAIARTTIPSVLKMLEDGLMFVGSTSGPAVLLQATKFEEEEDVEMATVEVEHTMEVDDDDDDIYGPSTTKTVEAPDGQIIKSKKTRSVVRVSLCDSLSSHGPIADLAFSVARNGDRPVPELVAATGSGLLGGFTLFQRDLPIHTKRKLHAIGGARGLWSLPIRQTGGKGDYDTLLLSTDANPSPGLSRITTRSTKTDISIPARILGTTIGAGPFFQNTAILHVLTDAICVLEPDGAERQKIKDVEGKDNAPRAKVRSCSIADPFVLVFREDDSIGLFTAVPDKGRIRRKDMSPMGDKASRYLTGCFFMDSTGVFGNDPTQQRLLLVRPQGVIEIWNLPKLTLVFSSPMLATLQNVITDSRDPPTVSQTKEKEDLDIDQVLIAPIGETHPEMHLFVLLRSGHFAIYQIVAGLPTETSADPAGARLDVKFVKILSRAFEVQRPEEAINKRVSILRTFVPFVTHVASSEPSLHRWILHTDRGGLQLYPSGHSIVHAFTPCSLWETKSDFLIYSEEGLSLLSWIPEFTYESKLPARSIPRGRPYSNVVFDPSTGLIVAASVLRAQFGSFDEDGNRVWEPDASNVTYPTCDCSALELISPESWITMDGFEFANNEFVNTVAVVTLETSSTDNGSKDFIAVGTTLSRGEDLAAKGCTYVFELVEVVPDASAPNKRWYKMRLRCRDEAKGPVTAICGFNGYLVSSMGQKIFVRAFDLDERLVGVAFLDVGVYVTSLRTLKNLLLIGDATKSVSFVAFQEDPYKLVLVSRDINSVSVTRADFFFGTEEMNVVTTDEEGVVRVYEFNPLDPSSNVGRHLLIRTEFHAQSEYRSSVVIAQRGGNSELPQSKVIYASNIVTGGTNGSLASITPMDEQAGKRLQLLQGQLTRNIQHVAGLNPKAYRIVRNDHVSKPLSKGIIDGNLVRSFEGLPTARQAEMTKQIGTEVGVVLRDWAAMNGIW
ncbi:CPSF A subunit region-domain-containing protein [Mycena floridula]|nr:CPSF A subunit region-domain-containing protein [Mycena floridula]